MKRSVPAIFVLILALLSATPALAADAGPGKAIGATGPNADGGIVQVFAPDAAPAPTADAAPAPAVAPAAPAATTTTTVTTTSTEPAPAALSAAAPPADAPPASDTAAGAAGDAYRGIVTGNWFLLAGAIMAGVILLTRSLLAKKWPTLQGDRWGIVIAAGMSGAAALAHVWIAGGLPDQHTLMGALKVFTAATAAYVTAKKLGTATPPKADQAAAAPATPAA